MRSAVVATAGHVDHGKSTLVRALTGIEPDRWAEERRRGLTIDLGFAWAALPSGRQVAFVDVPGHERFLGNMLAGLGPAPVVLFVVAADEGWSAQSDDHRDAVAALGIRHGVIVVTRADRAPDRVEATIAQAREGLADSQIGAAPAVVVSATEGSGLDELRAALDATLAELPEPDAGARVRLWVDRAFTITGAGTVVTGTLAAGTLACGDELELVGAQRFRSVTVRGLESQGEPAQVLSPVVRAAANLRGVSTGDVRRGDVLLTPGAWLHTALIDVRRATGRPCTELPEHLMVHVGTAAIPARVRPLGEDFARLTLRRAVPLVPGDRLVLRDGGGPGVLGGAEVLDTDPPRLVRRGDAARRRDALTGRPGGGDVLAEVSRRGAVPRAQLHRMGLVEKASPTVPRGVREVGTWWTHDPTYAAWGRRLVELVRAEQERDPLSQGLSKGAAATALGLPSTALLDALVNDTGVEQSGGHLRLAQDAADLGPAEASVAEIESRLAATPFAAPEADDLARLQLGPRELAAAERHGRLLRLAGGVVLLPSAPALAMRELAGLPQPFTTSQARQALSTSRRVVIPLLEHLDARGWTRRIDAGHRAVAR